MWIVYVYVGWGATGVALRSCRPVPAKPIKMLHSLPLFWTPPGQPPGRPSQQWEKHPTTNHVCHHNQRVTETISQGIFMESGVLSCFGTVLQERRGMRRFLRGWGFAFIPPCRFVLISVLSNHLSVYLSEFYPVSGETEEKLRVTLIDIFIKVSQTASWRILSHVYQSVSPQSLVAFLQYMGLGWLVKTDAIANPSVRGRHRSSRPKHTPFFHI